MYNLIQWIDPAASPAGSPRTPWPQRRLWTQRGKGEMGLQGTLWLKLRPRKYPWFQTQQGVVALPPRSSRAQREDTKETDACDVETRPLPSVGGLRGPVDGTCPGPVSIPGSPQCKDVLPRLAGPRGWTGGVATANAPSFAHRDTQA